MKMLGFCTNDQKPNDIRSNLEKLINKLELTSFQKNTLHHRFLDQVYFYELKSQRVEFFYNFGRVLMTIGGILLPAVVSIQNSETVTKNQLESHIFWTTFLISIIVTVCNGMITLFRLDKNYYMFKLMKERLKQEGWNFLQRAGKYRDQTYIESYSDFCEEIEKIKKIIVNQEYSEDGSSLTGTRHIPVNSINDNNSVLDKRNDSIANNFLNIAYQQSRDNELDRVVFNE